MSDSSQRESFDQNKGEISGLPSLQRPPNELAQFMIEGDEHLTIYIFIFISSHFYWSNFGVYFQRAFYFFIAFYGFLHATLIVGLCCMLLWYLFFFVPTLIHVALFFVPCYSQHRPLSKIQRWKWSAFNGERYMFILLPGLFKGILSAWCWSTVIRYMAENGCYVATIYKVQSSQR